MVNLYWGRYFPITLLEFFFFSIALLFQTLNPLDGDCISGSYRQVCLTDLLSAAPPPAYLNASADESLYFEFNLRYLNNPSYYDPHRYSVDGEFCCTLAIFISFCIFEILLKISIDFWEILVSLFLILKCFK